MTSIAGTVRVAREGHWLPRTKHGIVPIVICGVACLIALVAAVCFGSFPVPLSHLPGILLHGVGFEAPVDGREQAVVWSLRIPRAIVGLMVGGALASSGTALQALFRNPLADPGLLGLTAGASVGAAVGFFMAEALGTRLSPSFAASSVAVLAFGGGWVATWCVQALSSVRGRTSSTALLLAGVAVNAFGFAGVGVFTFLADDARLRSLTTWSLGGLGASTWTSALLLTLFSSTSIALLMRKARQLDALQLGEAEAFHMGVPVARMRRLLIVSSALGAGAAVAGAGAVGFVGLVVPHFARLLFGPGHRRLIPCAALLGGALLLAADLAGRVVLAPREVPLGVVTALVGAPALAFLVRRRLVLGEGR